MKSIIQKLKRGKSGFTLAETLIAVLILLMVSAIVAGALPAAANAYKKTVDAANAQVLLSTTMTVLRDELGTATEIEVDDEGESVTYKSGKSGNTCTIYNDADEGIMIFAYSSTIVVEQDGEMVEKSKEEQRPLVSTKAATGMVTSCTFDGSTPGVVVVSNLIVKDKDYSSELAEQETFTIRTVQKNRATTEEEEED